MTTCVLGHILRHLVHFALNERECVSSLCTLVHLPLSPYLLSPTLRHLVQGALGVWVCILLSPFGHRFLQSSVLGNLELSGCSVRLVPRPLLLLLRLPRVFRLRSASAWRPL